MTAKQYRGKERRDVAGRLEAHERECLMRYQVIEKNTESIEKRLWRIEWGLLVAGSAVVGLLTKLAFFQ